MIWHERLWSNARDSVMCSTWADKTVRQSETQGLETTCCLMHALRAEIEKAVFTPIKQCNNPVQLLFGTFLLLAARRTAGRARRDDGQRAGRVHEETRGACNGGLLWCSCWWGGLMPYGHTGGWGGRASRRSRRRSIRLLALLFLLRRPRIRILCHGADRPECSRRVFSRRGPQGGEG